MESEYEIYFWDIMLEPKRHRQFEKIIDMPKFYKQLKISDVFEIVHPRLKKHLQIIFQKQVNDWKNQTNEHGDTLLTYAASLRGKMEKIIQTLLEYGFDIHHVNSQGKSAKDLAYSIKNRHVINVMNDFISSD